MKRIVLSALAAVVCLTGLIIGLNHEQEELRESFLRLHIIANSDDEEDQRLKLLVRDQILEQGAAYLKGDTIEEVKQEAAAHQAELKQIAVEALRQNGCELPVEVSVSESYFPTKEYGDLSLPAGEYDALKIIIGEGKGQNWWCVCFPPICTGAAVDTSEVCLGYGVDEKTVELIKTKEGEEEKPSFRFKALELLGITQEFFK